MTKPFASAGSNPRHPFFFFFSALQLRSMSLFFSFFSPLSSSLSLPLCPPFRCFALVILSTCLSFPQLCRHRFANSYNGGCGRVHQCVIECHSSCTCESREIKSVYNKRKEMYVTVTFHLFCINMACVCSTFILSSCYIIIVVIIIMRTNTKTQKRQRKKREKRGNGTVPA